MKRARGQITVHMALFLLVIAALAALILSALWDSFIHQPDVQDVLNNLSAAAVTDKPLIMTEHAKKSHLEDSALISQCIETKGPYQKFKDKFEAKKYYYLCQLDDGRWGIQPLISTAAGLIVKTAFVPRDGSWNSVIAYLTQNATRFTGQIP